MSPEAPEDSNFQEPCAGEGISPDVTLTLVDQLHFVKVACCVKPVGAPTGLAWAEAQAPPRGG